MNIKSIGKSGFFGQRASHLAPVFGLILFLIPSLAMVEWEVITLSDSNSDTTTQVAYTKNEDGYSLEIYKDSVGAIHSRFSLNTALDRFAKRTCPSYQIDLRLLDNRSINDAPCLTDLGWSEFILGYIANNNVTSVRLNALMNGSTITFRFMLENGSYEETQFSLAGSKRATLSALGSDVTIRP